VLELEGSFLQTCSVTAVFEADDGILPESSASSH
jgi:hypothetical protein